MTLLVSVGALLVSDTAELVSVSAAVVSDWVAIWDRLSVVIISRVRQVSHIAVESETGFPKISTPVVIGKCASEHVLYTS